MHSPPEKLFSIVREYEAENQVFFEQARLMVRRELVGLVETGVPRVNDKI